MTNYNSNPRTPPAQGAGRRLAHFDLRLDRLAGTLLGHFQVTARLEPEPDAGRGAKVTRPPQVRVGGNGALAAQDLGDPQWRQQIGQLVSLVQVDGRRRAVRWMSGGDFRGTSPRKTLSVSRSAKLQIIAQ